MCGTMQSATIHSKQKPDMVEEWTSSSYRRETQQRVAINRVREYLAFTGVDPKQLIREQRSRPDDRPGQRRILAFYKSLLEEGKSTISAFNTTKFVRSFYSFYGMLLPFRPNELETPMPKMKDYPLELHHIQGMVYAANLRGKTLILVLESTGLRVGDVTKLLRKDVEPLLGKDPPIDIELCTEKERISAHTFLHKAAVEVLKEYLASRVDDSQWLFPTDNGRHLSTPEADRMVKTAFKKAGFESGNLRVRTHCLRKFTIGRLQDAGVEENLWKRIVGKKVPEAAYSSNKIREAYLTALPKLDPTSINNNQAKFTDLASKVDNLEKENSRLRLELNELKTKKTLEFLMDLFNKEKKEVLDEAFKKSVPVSAVNGKRVTMEPVKIEGGELMALKALARAFLKLDNKTDKNYS